MFSSIMSLGFNWAQKGSFFPPHLIKIPHFADFCREEYLMSKHTSVHCKSRGSIIHSVKDILVFE